MLIDETHPPNLDDPDYPPGCVNTPEGYRPLDYLSWHAMADARTRRGERSVHCATCERYRWTSTPCDGTRKSPPLYVTQAEMDEITRLMRERMPDTWAWAEGIRGSLGSEIADAVLAGRHICVISESHGIKEPTAECKTHPTAD